MTEAKTTPVLKLNLEIAQIKYAQKRQLLNSALFYATAGTCVYIDQKYAAGAAFLGGFIYNSGKF